MPSQGRSSVAWRIFWAFRFDYLRCWCQQALQILYKRLQNRNTLKKMMPLLSLRGRSSKSIPPTSCSIRHWGRMLATQEFLTLVQGFPPWMWGMPTWSLSKQWRRWVPGTSAIVPPIQTLTASENAEYRESGDNCFFCSRNFLFENVC